LFVSVYGLIHSNHVLVDNYLAHYQKSATIPIVSDLLNRFSADDEFANSLSLILGQRITPNDLEMVSVPKSSDTVLCFFDTRAFLNRKLYVLSDNDVAKDVCFIAGYQIFHRLFNDLSISDESFRGIAELFRMIPIDSVRRSISIDMFSTIFIRDSKCDPLLSIPAIEKILNLIADYVDLPEYIEAVHRISYGKAIDVHSFEELSSPPRVWIAKLLSLGLFECAADFADPDRKHGFRNS
jgi:hypothetical protein